MVPRRSRPPSSPPPASTGPGCEPGPAAAGDGAPAGVPRPPRPLVPARDAAPCSWPSRPWPGPAAWRRRCSRAARPSPGRPARRPRRNGPRPPRPRWPSDGDPGPQGGSSRRTCGTPPRCTVHETAHRVGISPDYQCAAALDAALARPAHQDGCRAGIRASYVDELDGVVYTTGVLAFPDRARAAAFTRRLPSARPPAAALRALALPGTASARFTDAARQTATDTAGRPVRRCSPSRATPTAARPPSPASSTPRRSAPPGSWPARSWPR